MVAGRLGEDPRSMDDTAAFGILGREPQRTDPGDADGRGAHRARLQADPNGAIIQSRCPERFGGGANGDHFRMRRRIR